MTSGRYITVHASNLVGAPTISLQLIYAGETRSVSLANDQTVVVDYGSAPADESNMVIGLDSSVTATDVKLDISSSE